MVTGDVGCFQVLFLGVGWLLEMLNVFRCFFGVEWLLEICMFVGVVFRC